LKHSAQVVLAKLVSDRLAWSSTLSESHSNWAQHCY